jgi:hypothetical protein
MSVRTVIGIRPEATDKAFRCRSVVDVVRAAWNGGRQQARIDAALTARDRAGTLDGSLSLAEHRARLTTESEEMIAALTRRVAELRS